MDLGEQLAAVWARKYIVLALALYAAVAVFGLRSVEAPTYEASSTLQARLPLTDSGDASTDASYYAESAIGLVTSPAVVADALDEAGIDGDPTVIADDVDAESAAQPGFVKVTARADSADGAAELANALVAAVDSRVAADQAEDLRAERRSLTEAIGSVERDLAVVRPGDQIARSALEQEREALVSALQDTGSRPTWRIATVSVAESPASPISPAPLRDALLAFLLALIVAAEAVVIWTALRGTLSARDPARDAGRVAGVPAAGVRSRDTAGALVPILPAIDDVRCVLVLHHGPEPDARAGLLLAELLAARGRSVLLVDLAPDNPSLQVADAGETTPPTFGRMPGRDDALRRYLARTPAVAGVRVLPAGDDDGLSPTEVGERLTRVVEAGGADVVVACASVERRHQFFRYVGGDAPQAVLLHVPRRHATKRTVRDDADALRGLGKPVVGVVVSLANSTESTLRTPAPAVRAPQPAPAAEAEPDLSA